MERIRELQSQLKTLYEKDTSHRLSERSCVSIILKLIARGELCLVYTQDGKEYLTQEQLANEIKRELNLHGGRINIVDLPPLLNVDISVIEEKVKSLVSRNIHILQGALLSSMYLESVAKQIEAMLQERGSITLIEMVTKFHLTSHFLSETIMKRYIGSTIHGVLDGDMLYTKTFLIRYKHTIRGIFNAITLPTLLSKIRVNYEFNQDLFESTLGELISGKELCGYIEGKGNRATYMPYLYVAARKKWIHNFLSQNGYIDYEMLQKLQISSPVSMMSTEYANEGIPLSQCFVSLSVIQDVEAAVTEFIAEDKGWLNIKTLFEFPLPTEDMIHILDRVPAVIESTKKKNTKILFVNSFLVTNGFLHECLQKYTDYVKENPSAVILPQTEIQEDKGEEDIKSSGKSRGKKTNRKQQQQQPQKKKQPPSKGGKTKEEAEREISTNLQKWFPPPYSDPFSSPSSETSEVSELYATLGAHLRPAIEMASAKVSQAVFRDTYQTVHKDKLKIFPGKMNAIFLNISLFDAGIQSLQDGMMRTSLSTFLLSTLCRDLFHLVLENQAIIHQIPLPAAPNPAAEVPGGDTVTHFTSDDVVRILALVPEPVKTPLKLMQEACNGQMLSKYMAAVETVASKIDCPLKKDKKSERQLLFQHRQDSVAVLQTTTDPVLGFHLILSVIHIRQCQVVLYVDPSNPGILLELLKDHVSGVIYKKLQTFWECVQEFKTTDGKDNELRKVLENYLNECKKFAIEKIDLEKYQE